MQNLFVKFLVLGSVIGSSCFVVWQAHDGLKSAASKVNPSEFVALSSASPSGDHPVADQTVGQANGSAAPAAVADWEQPLKLTDSNEAAEPVPTLAAAPIQSEEPAKPEVAPEGAKLPLDPLAAPPADAPPQQPEEGTGGLPLFFKAPEQSESMAHSMPPSPASGSEQKDPFAAPSQPEREADLAKESEPAAREFVELPDQQVERMSGDRSGLAALPQAEPLSATTPDLPPAQSEAAESLPSLDLSSPPVTEKDADKNAESTASKEEPVAEAREMPGLKRLSSPHATPVLLPIENHQAPAFSEKAPSEAMGSLAGKDLPAGNGVVNAAGLEVEASNIRKASGSLAAPVPLERARDFAETQSSKSLPQLEDMVRKSSTPAPAVEVVEADPFGGIAAAPPQPTPASTLPGDPRPTSRSSPGLFPEDGRTRRSPAELMSDSPSSVPPSREAPVLPDNQPDSSEPVAPAMPPLPPTGEVLPDALPASTAPPQGLDLPVQPPVPAAGEVLPFSTAPAVPAKEPAPTPAMSAPPKRDLPTLDPLPLQPESPEADPFGKPASSKPAPRQDILPEPPALPPVEPFPTVTPQPATMPPPGTGSAVNPVPTASPNLLLGTGDLDTSAPQGPQSPELKIEKIAPTEAEVGEPVVYAIMIRNVGGSAAQDVVVEDRIPRGAQLEGTIPQAYLNDGKLSWQLGTMAPGDERKIQLKVVPIEAGQIGSVATVSFAAAVSATIKVNSPRLTIAMAGPQEAAVGEPMNYRFTLKNDGESPAKSVYLRAVLPAGLTHPGGNDLEYESGLIAPGEQKDVHLVVQAEKAGSYTINAQVTNDGKPHAETRASVNVIKSRLEMTRVGTENRFVGRPAKFTLRVANTSSEVLRGVTVQETLAAGVDLPAIPSGGHWDAKTRLLTWKLDQLLPGDAREIDVTYTPRQAGVHRGSLVVMDAAGNKSTLETVLNAKGFSELTPLYQVDQRTVMVNERITLQVTLENAGTAASRNVRAQFILPEGIEFLSAQGPGEHQHQGNQVVFSPLDEFGVGSKETFHLAVLPHQAGTAKITFKLEADDYEEPVFQDQAIRIVPAAQ